VGFDQPKSLGRNQTGGLVALPIWTGYMERALKGMPDMHRIVPDGVVTADTFEISAAALSDAKHIPEYFYREFVPKDDSPPFTLLPTFEPPAAADAAADRPSVPNY
jgi:penicillin-binding protein 1A